MIIEILGFTGLAIITIALMQNDMIMFRILSLLGGIPFLTQAFMLDSYSLFITQIVFAVINIVMLRRLLIIRKYEKQIDKLLDMSPPYEEDS